MTRYGATTALVIAIVVIAISQLLIKGRMNVLSPSIQNALSLHRIPWQVLADPLLWMAVLLVAIGGLCWYIAMIKLPLSLMLPMAAAIAPIVSIGGWAFLGETLNGPKIAAILVIALGVAWLGMLEQ